VRRHNEKLAARRTKHVGKKRHEVSAEDLKTYFVSATAHLTSVPSELFWTADETCAHSAKHMSLSNVIFASGTKQGSITVPEIRDDAQLIVLTGISALGDSTHPYFISKIKQSRKQP
jgi:hypothetical protein